MKTWTIYDPKTGRIGGVLRANRRPRATTRKKYLDGAVSGRSHYFDDGVVAARPPMPLEPAENIEVIAGDVATISGVPVGARCVVILGSRLIAETKIDDGLVEIECNAPGVVKVRIECFPYLPAEIQVRVG